MQPLGESWDVVEVVRSLSQAVGLLTTEVDSLQKIVVGQEARLQVLEVARREETAAAFAQAPGRELDIDQLMLVDAGVIACTPALTALRAELGLPTPVVPSAREHSDLSRKLYKGRDLDTAFAPAVGG